jgi:hypothetical protein
MHQAETFFRYLYDSMQMLLTGTGCIVRVAVIEMDLADVDFVRLARSRGNKFGSNTADPRSATHEPSCATFQCDGAILPCCRGALIGGFAER